MAVGMRSFCAEASGAAFSQVLGDFLFFQPIHYLTDMLFLQVVSWYAVLWAHLPSATM